MFVRLKHSFRPLVEEEPQQPFCLSLMLTTFAKSGNYYTQRQPRFNQNQFEKCFIGNFNQINQHQLWLKWLGRIELPGEQRLHFRCVSWYARSSLCRQVFNFRETHDTIRKQNQSSCPSSNGASLAGIETCDNSDLLRTDMNSCLQRLLFACQLTQ